MEDQRRERQGSEPKPLNVIRKEKSKLFYEVFRYFGIHENNKLNILNKLQIHMSVFYLQNLHIFLTIEDETYTEKFGIEKRKSMFFKDLLLRKFESCQNHLSESI